jgi:hypothetical protein
VATHKLPPSRAALYSKTVSSLPQFSHHEPDERILPRCGGILLPSSSAPPLTGSYPAGILSLFERLKAVGHKLVAENFGLRAKPFSKDAKKPRTGAGLYSSESNLASVKLANRAIGRESSDAELVPRSLPVRPRTYETRASRHDHNEVCVIPGLSAQTVIGYNERRSRRQ